MAQDNGMTEALSPTDRPLPLSAAARMRRCRERRRTGVLCFRIELSEDVINELIRRKRLAPDYRAHPNAVGQAVRQYLDFTLL
jgi:hypothetical protein